MSYDPVDDPDLPSPVKPVRVRSWGSLKAQKRRGLYVKISEEAHTMLKVLVQTRRTNNCELTEYMIRMVYKAHQAAQDAKDKASTQKP